MIWLASYPRSGNTFFRNILFDVYGLSSGDFHLGQEKPLTPDFASYPIVKTHLLPQQLPPKLQAAKGIYLIRDGRDAAVSLAHHRKNIKKTKGSYLKNLTEITLGIGGSFKGGWSGHVKAWAPQAAIVIRYEDLITDPLAQLERLRTIMELPAPNIENLPSFQSQKQGIPKYGSGRQQLSSEKEKQARAQQFYRRGIAGAYKDEMPLALKALFRLKHGTQMKNYGY